jgi:hypothetical protein
MNTCVRPSPEGNPTHRWQARRASLRQRAGVKGISWWTWRVRTLDLMTASWTCTKNQRVVWTWVQLWRTAFHQVFMWPQQQWLFARTTRHHPVLVTEGGRSFSVQLAHAVRLPLPEAQRRVSVAAIGTEGNPRRPFRGPMKLQRQAVGVGRIGYPALPVNAEPDPLNSPCDETRLFTALDEAALDSTLSEGPGGVMYVGTWTRGAVKKPVKLDVADVTAHVRDQVCGLRVRRHSAKRHSATCPICRLFRPSPVLGS